LLEQSTKIAEPVRPSRLPRSIRRECERRFASERADRKIAQPQIGELAVLPQAEQRPVERLAQHVVAAPYRDADALAEEPALQERSAAKHATAGRIRAIEPERQRDAVTEQQVDFAAPQ